MSKIIDLHTHSIISDGEYSPSEIVKNAYKNNVKVIALTDHDSIAGIDEARKIGGIYDIKVINGIEISALYKDGNMIHILGFNMDITNKDFMYFYNRMKRAREATMDKILNIIRENNKITIDINILKKDKLDKCISRHDIHNYIIKNGICNDSKKIWNTYLDPIPYEKDELIEVKDAINMVKLSGGLSFLAHYNNKYTGFGRYNKEEIEEQIKYLISLGLDGVERYYPTFKKDDEEFLDGIIKKYNLLSSGGTDYHGKYRANNDIGIGAGNFYVPCEKTFLAY